jgi:hypothetical protein
MTTSVKVKCLHVNNHLFPTDLNNYHIHVYIYLRNCYLCLKSIIYHTSNSFDHMCRVYLATAAFSPQDAEKFRFLQKKLPPNFPSKYTYKLYKEHRYRSWCRDYAGGWLSRGSNPRRRKRFFSCPNHQIPLWGPPSFLFGKYRGSFQGSNPQGHELTQITSMWCRG